MPGTSKTRKQRKNAQPAITKPPKSVSPSVWDGVDNAAFNKSITQLRKKAVRHSIPSLTPLDSHKNQQSLSATGAAYGIPLSVETQLAADIAYLTAWEDDTACVTAATVAPMSNVEGLMITVAANSGLPQSVAKGTKVIIGNLQSCARCESSRTACAEACCRGVACMSHARIQHRLATGRNKASFVLKDRLQERLSTANDPDSFSAGALQAEMQSLVMAIEGFEAVGGTLAEAPYRRHDALMSIIRAAYDLAYGPQQSDTAQLRDSRLSQLYDTHASDQPRDVRSVHALAEYWRISLRLSASARSYRRIFCNIDLRVLEAPTSKMLPPGLQYKGFKVHAEIQLLFHHEANLETPKPRSITASKRPCFLCSAFMTIHGRYIIPDSHGEVHPMWTLPIGAGLPEPPRLILCETLRYTAKIVEAALSSTSDQHLRNSLPQSALDVTAQSVRQASVSTLLYPNIQPEEFGSSGRIEVAADDACEFPILARNVAEPLKHELVTGGHVELDQRRDSVLPQEYIDRQSSSRSTRICSSPVSDVVRLVEAKSSRNTITKEASDRSKVAVRCASPPAQPQRSKPSDLWLGLIANGCSSKLKETAAPGYTYSDSVCTHRLLKHDWLELHVPQSQLRLDSGFEVLISEHDNQNHVMYVLDMTTMLPGSEVTLPLDRSDAPLRVLFQLLGYKDIVSCVRAVNTT